MENQSFLKQSEGFRIEVKTDFDFDNSNPLQYHYLFRYIIHITNVSNMPAQLISRKWHIKDGRGEVKIVEGPGVVGETPLIQPGQSYQYSSFCPLPTLNGEMWGHFNMVDSNGGKFKIETPVFIFKVPSKYIDEY
jgi:ApaG protein